MTGRESLIAALSMTHPWWQYTLVAAALVFCAVCFWIAETD